MSKIKLHDLLCEQEKLLKKNKKYFSRPIRGYVNFDGKQYPEINPALNDKKNLTLSERYQYNLKLWKCLFTPKYKRETLQYFPEVNSTKAQKIEEGKKSNNKLVRFLAKSSTPVKDYATRPLVRSTVLTATLALATVGTYVLATIAPTTVERIITSIEVSLRPSSKEIDDLVPSKANPSQTIKDVDHATKNNSQITLNQETLSSVNNFSGNINNMLDIFSSIEGVVAPNFVIVEYNDVQQPTKLKLFCDLDIGNAVCLEYLIEDIILFESVFEKDSLELVDIVNGLNFLINDENLADVPVLINKLDLGNNKTGYVSKIKDERRVLDWNEEKKDYNLQEVYTFDVHYVDGDKIYKQSLYIPIDEAKNLAGFSQSNLDTLIPLYESNKASFYTDGLFEDNLNNPSKILHTASVSAPALSNTPANPTDIGPTL